jgi:transcription termination/antitermination protein NusG
MTNAHAHGQAELRWYAVAVHARQERAAEAGLGQRGFEVLLPVRREVRLWSDRIKQVQRPLFPGYVFARASLSPDRRVEMLKVRQVYDLVGRRPARLAEPIPDWEIDSLRKLTATDRMLDPVAGLTRGTEVVIASGPLRGARGVVAQAPDGRRRLTLQITLLGRGVRVALLADDVVASAEADVA